MNPMVDGWRGDDWFHNGAFRQYGLSYIWQQVATRDNSNKWTSSVRDQYDFYMRAGSAGALARTHGLDQIGFYRKITEHPAYDAFWQEQAMDRVLGARPLKVPTMLVQSLWDQEDIYGAMAVYRALEPKDTNNDMIFLTMGPWYHGQAIDNGSHPGRDRVGCRHIQAVAPRRAGAVPRPLPRGHANGRGAGHRFPERYESLAAAPALVRRGRHGTALSRTRHDARLRSRADCSHCGLCLRPGDSRHLRGRGRTGRRAAAATRTLGRPGSRTISGRCPAAPTC